MPPRLVRIRVRVRARVRVRVRARVMVRVRVRVRGPPPRLGAADVRRGGGRPRPAAEAHLVGVITR